MEFLELGPGTGLLIAFTWILLRNIGRSGFIHAMFRIDTIIGMMAGPYLVGRSINA